VRVASATAVRVRAGYWMSDHWDAGHQATGRLLGAWLSQTPAIGSETPAPHRVPTTTPIQVEGVYQWNK